MSVTVTCPTCNSTGSLPEAARGKSALCPKCRKRFQVPDDAPHVVWYAPPVEQAAAPTPKLPWTDGERMMALIGGMVILVIVMGVIWSQWPRDVGSEPTKKFQILISSAPRLESIQGTWDRIQEGVLRGEIFSRGRPVIRGHSVTFIDWDSGAQRSLHCRPGEEITVREVGGR